MMSTYKLAGVQLTPEDYSRIMSALAESQTLRQNLNYLDDVLGDDGRSLSGLQELQKDLYSDNPESIFPDVPRPVIDAGLAVLREVISPESGGPAHLWLLLAANRIYRVHALAGQVWNPESMDWDPQFD